MDFVMLLRILACSHAATSLGGLSSERAEPLGADHEGSRTHLRSHDSHSPGAKANETAVPACSTTVVLRGLSSSKDFGRPFERA